MIGKVDYLVWLKSDARLTAFSLIRCCIGNNVKSCKPCK